MTDAETHESTDAVLFEVKGSVGLVMLNRPSKMNAISLEMRGLIPRAIRKAEADPHVRAIVIGGAGDRAFSAGADISEFEAATSLVEARATRQPPNWNDVIAASPKPTVAAIQGYCLGGGLELALACDVRIAADDAVFGLPEVQLAIIPGAGGTQRLPRIVGLGHALKLILSGERIDAKEAFRIGLVNELVPRDSLLDHVTKWAEGLSRCGPIALQYAKESARRGIEMSIDDGLRLEAELATLLTNTADRLEGAAAFRERRPPAYRGE
jgi:enoyl-CoA hydratase/carnithine racemase